MRLMDFFLYNGWQLVHTAKSPGRERELFDTEDLHLCRNSLEFLKSRYPSGVYGHQKAAIERFLAGENICVTTGAASGKSLVFQVAAIEELAKRPSSYIVAIYPLKALGREQEDRLREALELAGIGAKIGRIDGQTPVGDRVGIVRASRVLVMTPDIIHAWLLSNLSNRWVIQALKNISVIFADEIHSYTGVFGSNSAFMFRRLMHVMGLLRADPVHICFSATIANPARHLENLFGLEFSIIGPEADTSPKHPVEIHLVRPPGEADLLSEISELLHFLSTKTDSRFIAFVDSRKQTEHISSILARYQDEAEKEPGLSLDHLERLDVLPYRAGYEEHDSKIIQRGLAGGKLRGVISTSALELGIDIPHLDTAILIGVPHSTTSLLQRIGRIGRHGPGRVIVVNTGDVYDEAAFRNPSGLMDRPLSEATLYLENSRVQYIHALCLARHGGEHDQICSVLNMKEEEALLSSPVKWPEGFIDLCRKERLGEIPMDLQSMKSESGDDPNHVFPLRDVESQFRVELKQGPESRALGHISYDQLLREAYPGAVYYYATQPFRVFQINAYSKTVFVRREKRYITRPLALPTLVFPNLTAGNVFECRRYSDLVTAECNLQIRESICGYRERRGPNEFDIHYPPDRLDTGIIFNLPRFTRNYFTTGVVITHPVLSREGVNCEYLASLLLDVFLVITSFERRDISCAMDRMRARRGPIDEGRRFLAIYDQTYGSLRISGRLLCNDVLARTFDMALDLALHRGDPAAGEATIEALEALCKSVRGDFSVIPLEPDDIPKMEGKAHTYEKVLLPGSKGWDISRKSNEEFRIEGIFFSPRTGGLCYRGRHESTTDETVVDAVPVKFITGIPGESEEGFYNYETGEVVREI